MIKHKPLTQSRGAEDSYEYHPWPNREWGWVWIRVPMPGDGEHFADVQLDVTDQGVAVSIFGLKPDSNGSAWMHKVAETKSGWSEIVSSCEADDE